MAPSGLPCSGVDIALIAAVKRSPWYRAIRSRIIHPYPSDAWYEDHVAFVVFDLSVRPKTAQEEMVWRPQVLYAVDAVSRAVLAARIVESDGVSTAVLDAALPENV